MKINLTQEKQEDINKVPHIEKWIEEWAIYPNGERHFIKKYLLGKERKEQKKKIEKTIIEYEDCDIKEVEL